VLSESIAEARQYRVEMGSFRAHTITDSKRLSCPYSQKSKPRENRFNNSALLIEARN